MCCKTFDLVQPEIFKKISVFYVILFAKLMPFYTHALIFSGQLLTPLQIKLVGKLPHKYKREDGPAVRQLSL